MRKPATPTPKKPNSRSRWSRSSPHVAVPLEPPLFGGERLPPPPWGRGSLSGGSCRPDPPLKNSALDDTTYSKERGALGSGRCGGSAYGLRFTLRFLPFPSRPESMCPPVRHPWLPLAPFSRRFGRVVTAVTSNVVVLAKPFRTTVRFICLCAPYLRPLGACRHGYGSRAPPAPLRPLPLVASARALRSVSPSLGRAPWRAVRAVPARAPRCARGRGMSRVRLRHIDVLWCPLTSLATPHNTSLVYRLTISFPLIYSCVFVQKRAHPPPLVS